LVERHDRLADLGFYLIDEIIPRVCIHISPLFMAGAREGGEVEDLEFTLKNKLNNGDFLADARLNRRDCGFLAECGIERRNEIDIHASRPRFLPRRRTKLSDRISVKHLMRKAVVDKPRAVYPLTVRQHVDRFDRTALVFIGVTEQLIERLLDLKEPPSVLDLV